jgi:hypothetical protein
MTDIVERLRTFEAWEKVVQRHKLAQEAADEIERLRAALREIVELTAEGCCDDEDGILIANAAERIAKEALGDE